MSLWFLPGPEHFEDVTAASKMNAVEEEDDVFVDTDDEDKVEAYWGSDHHKFEWSDYMQSLDPRSWHALGLGIPESFLSKGWYSTVASTPFLR